MSSQHSKLASDWELFVTLRKQKNKEMKRLKRALFTMTRLPHCGGRSMDLRQPGGQQSSARHAIRIHARK
jgi:hypothetical protein